MKQQVKSLATFQRSNNGDQLLSGYLPLERYSIAGISQTTSIVLQEGQDTSLECTQTEAHERMFWYRQDEGLHLQFLYHFYFETRIEKGIVSDRFQASRPQTKDLNLKISLAERQDSAVYFCASSLKGDANAVFFGQGTRLTILEKGQNTSPPEVTIFAPSEEELTEKQKVTIVCLATKFFPDHVNLTWYLNDEVRTDGVKTETPEYNSTKKQYSLISRIRITSKEWQNSNNKFKCNVEFYNEAGKSDYSDEISGKECDDGSAEVKETYLRRANLGKLVYILLIFKSTLYGAFVMGLKLRKKVVP